MVAITLYILPHEYLFLVILLPFLTDMLFSHHFTTIWQGRRFDGNGFLILLLLKVASTVVVGCIASHYEHTGWHYGSRYWWRWLCCYCHLLMWLWVTGLGRNLWKLHWVVIIGSLAVALLEIFKQIVCLYIFYVVFGVFWVEWWTRIWRLVVSWW